MKLLAGIITLFSFTAFSSAAVVEDCSEGRFGISSIVPKSEKTYANGEITMYELDSIEPAASAQAIAINIWVNSEEMPYMDCKLVTGLTSVGWENKVSEYVDGLGLVIKVPVSEMNAEGGFDNYTLKLVVDRSDKLNPKVKILN